MGHEIPSEEQFAMRIVDVLIEECHIIEKW